MLKNDTIPAPREMLVDTGIAWDDQKGHTEDWRQEVAWEASMR